MNVFIICITILLVFLLLFFCFIFYHQMLLLNEVNKRLMIQTKEAVEKERLTQEEYVNLIKAYDEEINKNTSSNETTLLKKAEEDDEIFNPHDY